MSNFFHTIFYIPIETTLMFFYQIVGENLGYAVILLTLVIRIILIPLTLPSLKSAKKMQEIKPEIDAIKKRYAKDPQQLQKEQLALYKKYGINPATGCLPILLQLPILIFLYNVLTNVFKNESINQTFLYFNLSEPDKYFILPILAAVSQFVLSFMMSPEPSKKKVVSTEKKEEDFADSLTNALQTQNLYVMPLLWFFMLLKLPSGIGIYWVFSTIFSLVQQWIFMGPGRLKTIFNRKRPN
jgi:YidC/Oxa1 family membrane protein insertase